MEEGFLGVFCDLIYGGLSLTIRFLHMEIDVAVGGVGWMDKTDRLGIGSGGGGEREGSWALVSILSFISPFRS